jgi:co-chaperonin GroES (HSP10)
MKLELFGTRLLILCDEMVEKIGRIIVPEKHSERSRTAVVVACGDRVENYQTGDKILLSWYTGVHLHLPGAELFGVPVDEDRHRLVREDEILGKLKD